MITRLRRFFGLIPCSICGKPGTGVWERTSTDLHSISSAQHGEKWMKIKATIDCSGLCGDCFTPRADKAIKALDQAFAGIFPEVRIGDKKV